MALSISSSKASARFFVKLLGGICLCLLATTEIASEYLLRHHSETYARVSRQYFEAVETRAPKPGEPMSVVLVGNSLLLDGVDLSRLGGLTSSQIRIYPIFLEATGYYDWFYGLQRLFREGARPPVVVVGFGIESLVAESVRQDYVPLMLFDLKDSLAVASDLQMDRTSTTNLVLAHWSVFWDTRSVIRTQILRRVIPGERELVALLKPPTAMPPAAEFASVLPARVRRLRELCEAHGARLILLIPPTPSSAEWVEKAVLTAHDLGVETMVPLDANTLSARYYQADNLHLNSEGAALFTSALATLLPRTVIREPASHSALLR